MSTVSGAALVGRADELQRLRECCRGIAEGAGTLVLVDGDAGTGKTRLVAEVMKAPFLPRGYAAVSAGALDYARAPYAPIRDLLVALDKRFPKVLAGNPALAAALRPVLEFQPVDTEAGGDQRRILDAVVAVLEKYAAGAPIMLAVEDVHWIDRASADVLLHLSRRIKDLRALMMVSFRPGEARDTEQVGQLVAHLARNASVSLSLKPLAESDALLLIDGIADADLPMSVRRRICEMSEGNPLLLVEYTKLASENPQKLHGPLPMTLKGLVADRLAGFDSVDVDVLRVAAEMGQFELELLADIAGVSADRVVATLKKARNASIVDERAGRDGGFIFRHALIRHAITDELLSVERKPLNRRIAARLERDANAPSLHSRLAHHYAVAGENQKARLYSEIAAAEAMSVYAFADAAYLLEHAVDGRELSTDTVELYQRLGDAYAQAQRTLDAVRVTENLFAFAVERDDSPAIGKTGFELSRRRYQLLDDDGAITAIKQALKHVDAAAHPAITFDLHATLAWYLGSLRRVDDAVAALLPATTLLEHGDDEARIRYHEAQAYICVHGSASPDYRTHIESALRIAETRRVTLHLRRMENAIGLALASNMDDMEFALDLCARFEETASQTLPNVAAPYWATIAWPLYLSGQFARARRALQPVFTIAEDAPLIAFFLARTGIPLALHLEDPLLLRRCARPRLLETAFASKTPNVFGPVAAAVAAQFRVEKRSGEATALLEHTVKRLRSAANNLPLLIEVARANVGTALPRALELLAQLSPESRSARAAWHLCSAYAARGAERTTHALQATQFFHEVRWAVYEAEALEVAGERAEALAIYRTCGSLAGMRRLETRESQQSASGLSKREWEVAELVAAGKSNKAIASELVVSERTVENHIASIFSKLNLRSRTEVATFVTRSQSEQA